MRVKALYLSIPFIILSCGVLYALTVFTAEPPSHVVCDIWPPYQFRDGDQITGLSVETVEAVYDRMGIPIKTLKAFPWKRALEIFMTGHADALFSANFTKGREATSYYPTETLFDAPWVIWTRKDSSIQTMEDLRGRRIGVVIGYSYTEEFWNFIETNCKIEKVTTDDINMNKLAMKRLDAVVAEYGNARFLIDTMHLKDIVPHNDIVIKRDGLYIIFNRAQVDAAFVHQFSNELKIFKTTQEYQQLRSKYLGEGAPE